MGNADAHGKNLSMVRGSKGIRLAPFYDILSTTVYGDDHDTEFAMSIGREYDTKKLTRDNWMQLAKYLDVSIKLIDRVNSNLIDSIRPAVVSVSGKFESMYGNNATIDKIIQEISVRTEIHSKSMKHQKPQATGFHS